MLLGKKVTLPAFSQQLKLYRDLEIIKPGPELMDQVLKINSILGRLLPDLQDVSEIKKCLENGGTLTSGKRVHEMHLLRNSTTCETKGVIVFHKESSTTLKIDALAVDRECKRQKLGTILLLFAMKTAQENSQRNMTLITSREGVFLYHSFGFRAKDGYSKDSWAKLGEKKQLEALDYARSMGSLLKFSLDDKLTFKKVESSIVNAFELK